MYRFGETIPNKQSGRYEDGTSGSYLLDLRISASLTTLDSENFPHLGKY